MTSPEQFLEYDTLRYGETRTGREERLLALGEQLTEQLALHFFFTPYQQNDQQNHSDSFTLARSILRHAIKNAAAHSQQHDSDGGGDNGGGDHIHAGRYVSDRNLDEIVALGLHSGALQDPSPLHIDDLCGGSGILSHGLAVLRGDHFATTTNVIDREPHHMPKFDAFARAFGREAMSRFIPIDIKQYRIKPRYDRPTHILAKHACGAASDHILDALKRSPAYGFSHAAILTCCHGDRREPPRLPTHLPNACSISADDWQLLLKTADWITDANHIEHRIPGRVAMRIIDCLRAAQLPLFFHAHVKEILDADAAPKNHAIIVEPE